MNNLKVDSTKMVNLVSRFNDCVKIYSQSIDEFFTYIVNNTSWVGSDAEEYVTICSSEKPDYTDYAQTLLILKNNLEDIADSLNKTIKDSGGNK